MYKILVVALFAACAINVVSLCGHLAGISAPMPVSTAASPQWMASAFALPASAD